MSVRAVPKCLRSSFAWEDANGYLITKHIEIQYYYVADRIAKGNLSVVWCPTDKMIADYLTKPLQGQMFIRFRDVLMGAVPMWHDVD